MKKVFLMMFLFMFALVGCNGEGTEQQTTEEVYDNYLSVVIGDDSHSLGFNDTEDSLFELIQASEIHLEFTDTDYGPMITEIGDYAQDAFHWISFSKNNVMATVGLNQIEYQDGDTFEFFENISTWEQEFYSLQLDDVDETSLFFNVDGYDVMVDKANVDVERLFVGSQYTITGHAVTITDNVVEFEVSEFTHVFDYISVVIGEETHDILYRPETDKSAFQLIDESDIELDYITTEYGPMITRIGDLQQDSFHWLAFTINDEFADSGLDTVEYQNGDVITFNENLSTWDQTFTLELKAMNETSLLFEIDNYVVSVDKTDIETDKLIVGGEYIITGQPVTINDNEVDFEVSEFVADFEYISIILGDETHHLIYDGETDKSAFQLIEESDIELDYITTEYGPMITRIGDLQQDDFHWLSFTVNDDFASAGLDTIEYQDGDVFAFTEEISTWEVTVNAEIIEIGTEEITFQNDNQEFIVEIVNLPDTMVFTDLVVGFIYDLSGMVDVESSNETIVFDPSSIELDVITDFTDLYDLEVGDIFILQFEVTFVEESSEFGIEIFAEDINGLSSTNISGNMSYPSTTDYIFYTIPNGYELVENNTYIGRFIYQINEPSQIPQITLYEQNINGETLENVIVE